MKKHFSILALAFVMPFCSASAFDQGAAQDHHDKSAAALSFLSADTWQTTTTRNIAPRPARQKSRSIGKKPHSIGKRPANIAALRAEAMAISMRHLPRLRPYATDYPRMVRAVRAYWRKNTRNPSATRLTNTIMAHVQTQYQYWVRPKLRSGIAKGIRVLKRKLRKS